MYFMDGVVMSLSWEAKEKQRKSVIKQPWDKAVEQMAELMMVFASIDYAKGFDSWGKQSISIVFWRNRQKEKICKRLHKESTEAKIVP